MSQAFRPTNNEIPLGSDDDSSGSEWSSDDEAPERVIPRMDEVERQLMALLDESGVGPRPDLLERGPADEEALWFAAGAGPVDQLRMLPPVNDFEIFLRQLPDNYFQPLDIGRIRGILFQFRDEPDDRDDDEEEDDDDNFDAVDDGKTQREVYMDFSLWDWVTENFT